MRRAVGTLLVVFAFVVSACSGSRPTLEEADGVAREVDGDAADVVTDAGEPVTLRLAVGVEWSGDPADAGPASVVTRVLADLLHEGLTRLDDDRRPVPALAERWVVSDDRLTWTFILRDGLVDGDGAAVTARDVMRSLDRVAARGRTDHAAVALTAVAGWVDRMTGDAGGVAGLSAPDDTTLVIRLDRPFELLPEVLAAPAYGITGRDADGDARTTGAYRYGEADDVLVAIDDAAPVARIELIPAVDVTGADLLGSGAVDWAVLPAGQGVDEIPGSIIRQPLDIRVGVAVRLADAELRHGLLQAIEPLALTRGILAFAPLPSPVADTTGTLPVSVAVEVPDGRLSLVGDALADQLAAAGVDVTRIESDATTFAGRVVDGAAVVFPVVLSGGIDDEVTVIQSFAPGAVDDVFGAESEVRSALAAGIEAERDEEQRSVLVAALEQAMVDSGLLRVVGQVEVRLGVGPSLTGLTHNADGTLVLDDVSSA